MIQEIRDRQEWNGFLLGQPTQAGIFLQSWEWGEFQKAVGRKVYRLVNSSQSSVHSFAQVVELLLPLGKKYWYIPRGALIEGLVEEAKQQEVLFLRIEPLQQLHATRYTLHVTRSVSPPQTLIIDLSKSEDELLSAMHEKTRYNIRLAARKGVTTTTCAPHHKMSDRTFCGGPVEFDNFWRLLQETAKRDGFRTHPAEYYKQMLEILGNPKSQIPNPKQISNIQYPISNSMHVRFHATYHESTMLAGAIVAYFGDTATYLHGASSYEHRALMGPYALHWEIMRDAKARGYKFYDFWGINVADSRQPPPAQRAGLRPGGTADSSSRKLSAVSRRHDWSGMTKFKMGFGGKVVNYPGTLDLPLSKAWYTLYRLGRKMLP